MRHYKRKSERGSQSKDVYELASAEVLEKKTSVRKAAKKFNLCHVSLFRYLNKKKNDTPISVGYVKPRLVFKEEEEAKICDYLLTCSNIYFGLLPLEVRKLAYQCAVMLEAKNLPPSWRNNEAAGPDWFKHFMERNPRLSRKAKENHVIMLSFPPHCSHNLQPLDVGVYGPFKNYLSRTQTAWMHNNPGKTMTIYDIPGIVKDTLPLAMNPSNIINGFKATGIWPLNADIFNDSDFAPSYVTDRPNPVCKESETDMNITTSSLTTNLPIIDSIDNCSLDISVSEIISSMENCDPVSSNITRIEETLLTTPLLGGQPGFEPTPGPSGIQKQNKFSPSKIRPYPKAPPRKLTNRPQRKRKCSVLTDTPEKNELEKEQDEKLNKIKKTQETKKGKGKGKKTVTKNREEKDNLKKVKRQGIEKVKKKVLTSDSESEPEEWFCLACGETYKDSNEEWIQCIICKMWAHVKCAVGNKISFVCLNCHSDED